jgi:CheY-like chemotaxis protein
MIPKILIVDDEKDIVLLINQMFHSELKKKLYEFEFKFSVDEAIEYVHSAPIGSILLIISDIHMPVGKNGIELLKEIKKDYNIPIFLFTAYDDETNKMAAKLFNADKYIVKPINFNELREDIMQVISSNK